MCLDDFTIFSKEEKIPIADLDNILDILSGSGISLTLKDFAWLTQSVS